MIPQRSTIIDKVNAFPVQWCVYEHHLSDPTTGRDDHIYIGVCKLVEVYHFPDAKRNSEWTTRVTPQSVITIKIIQTGDRADCINERGRMLSVTRPVCNMRGFDYIGRSTGVFCNENGMLYESQSEAAKALGLHQARISGHLAGKPGYARVGGYTFRRAE